MSNNTQRATWGDAVGSLVAIPVIVVLWGWWIYLAWNWYAVDLGAPHIAYGTACGLGVIESAITYKKPCDPPESALAGFIEGLLQLALFFAMLGIVGLFR